MKPGCEAQLKEIEEEIKYKVEKVDWLPNFYSLPPQKQIANSKAYQEGKVTIEDSYSQYNYYSLEKLLKELIEILVHP